MYEFSCYIQCPEGTYLDNGECRNCNKNCPICWGAEIDSCGSIPGVKSSVVFLENEIKDFLKTYTFTMSEIDSWINSLKIILKQETTKGNEDVSQLILSQDDIYNSDLVEAELPLGSFSKLDGIFIPIPSYINKNKELIDSHWVFKKGMWDGRQWVDQYFPRLPTYIKNKGQKNKIYIENNGYWIYDQMRDWYWTKAKSLLEPLSNVVDELGQLNLIKIDVLI
jgi:hypothetical protein